MYCPSCGAAVARGLSYCNHCGAKLGGAEGGSAPEPPGVKPELVVSSMVALFIFGLGAIAVLVGVLKQVAGFDTPALLAVTLFSLVLMLAVEGVLIGLLLRGGRGAKGVGDTGRPKGQTTKELGEAHVRALPGHVPSVTEHTTRAFEPAHGGRQPK